LNLFDFWWLPFGKVPEISVDELSQWLTERKPVQLVDARTAMEYEQGTIQNAWHAPVTRMPGSLERIELDPTLPVVMLCLSGHRSLPGTRWLRAKGLQAYSLKGGIIAWKQAGYPLSNHSDPS
jgi:rhodanese-related sulfurtransferase